MDLLVSSDHAEDESLESIYGWKIQHPSFIVASQGRNAFSEWLEKSEFWDTFSRSTGYHSSETTAYSKGIEKALDLLSESLIDDAIFTRAVEMMRYLFTARTIYASIAPDGGDLVFYWKAGPISIEIDLLSDGGAWWSVDGLDAFEFTGTGPELPLVELKHYLNIFSKEVDAINPNWRSLQGR